MLPCQDVQRLGPPHTVPLSYHQANDHSRLCPFFRRLTRPKGVYTSNGDHRRPQVKPSRCTSMLSCRLILTPNSGVASCMDRGLEERRTPSRPM